MVQTRPQGSREGMWVKYSERCQVSGLGVNFLTSEGGYCGGGQGEFCSYIELLKGIYFLDDTKCHSPLLYRHLLNSGSPTLTTGKGGCLNQSKWNFIWMKLSQGTGVRGGAPLSPGGCTQSLLIAWLVGRWKLAFPRVLPQRLWYGRCGQADRWHWGDVCLCD